MKDRLAGLSASEIEEISIRCGNAMRGPWVPYLEGRDHTAGDSFVKGPDNDIYMPGISAGDLEFICHARSDVPKLINEIERLQKLLREVG